MVKVDWPGEKNPQAVAKEEVMSEVTVRTVFW